MFVVRFFYPLLRKSNNGVSSRMQFSTSLTFKEDKIKIRNYEINYLRVGRGPHHVFFAPGGMGTIWSDYKKQIEGFNHDKFSLVVWDPPGYGKSIAVDNKEAPDIFYVEADIAYEFMKALQIPRYSALGWSYGGTVCLFLASRYPDVINKVVSWGCSTFFSAHEIEYLYSLRNLNNWSKSTKEALIKLYGEEGFIKKIDNFVKSRLEFIDSKKTTCDEVRRVECPTLLLHSVNDPIIDSRHMDVLKGLIENSSTYLYTDGGHSIHVQHADDFNRRVQEFLLQPNPTTDSLL